MKTKFLYGLLLFFSFFLFVGCDEKKYNDDSCLDIIRNALNKAYENNEIINSSNIQKNMEGNWIIVEAPANTTRSAIPETLDEATKDIEWQSMFITVCNTKTNKCKDLRLFKNSEGKLYVGSESGAIASNE